MKGTRWIRSSGFVGITADLEDNAIEWFHSVSINTGFGSCLFSFWWQSYQVNMVVLQMAKKFLKLLRKKKKRRQLSLDWTSRIAFTNSSLNIYIKRNKKKLIKYLGFFWNRQNVRVKYFLLRITERIYEMHKQ